MITVTIIFLIYNYDILDILFYDLKSTGHQVPKINVALHTSILYWDLKAFRVFLKLTIKENNIDFLCRQLTPDIVSPFSKYFFYAIIQNHFQPHCVCD